MIYDATRGPEDKVTDQKVPIGTWLLRHKWTFGLAFAGAIVSFVLLTGLAIVGAVVGAIIGKRIGKRIDKRQEGDGS